MPSRALTSRILAPVRRPSRDWTVRQRGLVPPSTWDWCSRAADGGPSASTEACFASPTRTSCTASTLSPAIRSSPVSGRLSAYRMDLTDEIDFDGTLFANVNLPPTRRQGLEAEIDWTVIAGVK